jgi:hypothetical protein
MSRSLFPKNILAWIVLVAFGGPVTAADALSIHVIEGQGAINNVRARTARAPVVELRDEQGDPVPGVSVTFQTPATGPSATFGTEHLLVTQTGSDGRATGFGLTPNDVDGPFDIRVTASYRSQVANASIKQVNASPSEPPHSSKKILWIGLAAGAAAGGVLAAAHGHGSPGTPPAASSSGTLVAGPTTFGPPK